MHVTELLYVAEIAIEDRDKSHDRGFDLCIRGGVISCIPTRQLLPTDKFVCVVTKQDQANGLDSSKWNQIFRVLHMELQQGRIK